MTVVYIILALLAVIAVLSLLLTVSFKRLKKARTDIQRLSGAFETVRKRAGRLQKAQSEDKKIMEESDEKRKELTGTTDSDLVTRANALFPSGVCDNKSSQ